MDCFLHFLWASQQISNAREAFVKNKMVGNQDHHLYLMGRVATGDQGAFAELFDLSAPAILGFLVRHLRARAEAEEVLQEVFLQIWEQAGAYRPDGLAPLSWMLMLARHRAIDRLRSEVSRLRRETRYEDHPEIPRCAAPLGTHRIEAGERQKLIASTLRDLPAEQRTCIELAFFQGLTHQDIADRLKAPLGTVKSRIRKGLSEMKKSMAAERGPLEATPTASSKSEPTPRVREPRHPQPFHAAYSFPRHEGTAATALAPMEAMA
jgi:RNA polymerase sigma-70 factor (ECF subfamily)